MSEAIGLKYQLKVTVLTPLHIGSGTTLMQGFDFEVSRGQTYRLREQVILDDYWPEDPDQQRLLMGKPLSELLQPQDYEQQPHYFSYVLEGEPELREIRECIKDTHWRPYLPGSSLKGALRTALMRTALDESGHRLARHDFGRSGGRWAAQRADDPLDRELFGRNANHDLLRAIQVGDSHPLPMEQMSLTRVHMVPGLELDVEALVPGTRLTVPLRLDAYLLDEQRDRLGWSDALAELIFGFAAACQGAAMKRLAQEYRYHAGRERDTAATNFYVDVVKELGRDQSPGSAFFLQVGFAAGWRSKSVLGDLEDDDPLLGQIIHEFELDRGGKRKGASGGHKPGDPFPKARHLANVPGRGWLPMGWLRLEPVLVPGPPLWLPDEPPEPPVSPPDEPPEPPLTPGTYTGTVVYYNFRDGEGSVRLEEDGLEVQVRAENLHLGTRFLAKDQRVKIGVIHDGKRVKISDVRPA